MTRLKRYIINCYYLLCEYISYLIRYFAIEEKRLRTGATGKYVLYHIEELSFDRKFIEISDTYVILLIDMLTEILKGEKYVYE